MAKKAIRSRSVAVQLSQAKRVELAKRWKDKVVVSLDDTGYLRAGWGYDQSVPAISKLNERLRENPDVLSAINQLEKEQALAEATKGKLKK